MNKSMIVLYLKSTGHVLAALTLSKHPEEQITANDLAGRVFKSRYILGRNPKDHGKKSVDFSSESLEIAEVKYDSDVFSSPYEYYISKTEQGQDEIHNVIPGLATAQNIKTVQFQNGKVIIALDNPVTGDTTVWVQIIPIGNDEIQTVSGQIEHNAAGDKDKIALTVNTNSGVNYHVLTLVSGRPLLVGLNKTVGNSWP